MQVGSLVECVGTFKERKQDVGCTLPTRGETYTIRQLVDVKGSTGVLLEEIVNPIINYNGGKAELSFHIKGFRELQPPMKIYIQQLLPQMHPYEAERI